MANPERYHPNSERTAEIEKVAGERSAELSKNIEAQSEREKQVEHLADARIEAEKQAKPVENYHSGAEEEKAPPAHQAMSPGKAYKHTMRVIQQDMSTPSRIFSKVIHNKAVEKASDIAGTTIARPNAILSGAICSFLLVLGLYLHARYWGYALSGFETIAAFSLGWVIGIVFDVLKAMVQRKH